MAIRPDEEYDLSRLLPVDDFEEEEEEPPSAAAFQNRGDQCAAAGRLHEAIQLYKQAIRMEGDNPIHHTRLGDACLYAEQSGQAISHYRRALQANPGHGEVALLPGELYRRFGKLKAAISQYRKAIKLVPDNAYYRYRLASAYNQKRQPRRRRPRVREIDPHLPHRRASTASGWATCTSTMQWLPEAIAELESAVIHSPYDDYYCVRLGMAYGQAGGARTRWRSSTGRSAFSRATLRITACWPTPTPIWVMRSAPRCITSWPATWTRMTRNTSGGCGCGTV